MCLKNIYYIFCEFKKNIINYLKNIYLKNIVKIKFKNWFSIFNSFGMTFGRKIIDEARNEYVHARTLPPGSINMWDKSKLNEESRITTWY